MFLVWVAQLHGKSLGPVYGAGLEVMMLRRAPGPPGSIRDWHSHSSQMHSCNTEREPELVRDAALGAVLLEARAGFGGLQPECLI